MNSECTVSRTNEKSEIDNLFFLIKKGASSQTIKPIIKEYVKIAPNWYIAGGRESNGSRCKRLGNRKVQYRGNKDLREFACVGNEFMKEGQ
jgi:hypothetical protein